MCICFPQSFSDPVIASTRNQVVDFIIKERGRIVEGAEASSLPPIGLALLVD